jgi:hypothetical protein
MKIFAVLIGLIIALSSTAQAATRLGLHVTDGELAVWQARAVSGPYKSAGDASTRSPGDWDRAVTLAASFASDPIQDLWQGQTASGVWLPNGHVCTYTRGGATPGEGGCVPTRGMGSKASAAAFLTLVQPQTYDYSSQLRTLFIEQLTETAADFANTAKWGDQGLGDAFSGSIVIWVVRLAYAYDYIRIAKPNLFSGAEKLAIETWISNAAFYWGRNSNYTIVNNVVPNRNSLFDSEVDVGIAYSSDTLGTTPNAPTQGFPNSEANLTHYDCVLNVRGNLTGAGNAWNDRSAAHVLLAAVGSHINGTLSNDAQTKRWAKMWFKEWLTYGAFPSGMVFDYGYWNVNGPTNGWQYSSQTISSMEVVADVFARAGDTSLYDFTTSAGKVFSNNPSGYSANTNGGPKGLLMIMQRHAGFVNQRSTGSPGWVGSEDSYAAASGGPHCGGDRADYLIQPVDIPAFGGDSTGSATARIEDTRHATGNVYYRDAGIKAAYTRTSSGAPAYPTSAVTNTDAYAYGGAWWTFTPGVLFMFGQMEDDAANPYLDGEPPSGTGQLELRVIRRLQ